MYTHCPFCKRDTVEQNLCIVCYFNFNNLNKKSYFSYDNKLNYFKKTLKNLSVKIYFDVSEYKDGSYREILQHLPLNKRKSFVCIQKCVQNLISLIKNDNKILTEIIADITLEYYILYMEFLYETKVKISNIKFFYFIINHLLYNIC